MANMRAYEDGNRLIIVLENPETSIMQLVRMFLSSQLPGVEHLGEPPAMKPPALDYSEMPEITPEPSTPQKPKFVQKRMNGQTNPNAGGENQLPDVRKTEEIEPSHAVDISVMSIFELRSFIHLRRDQLRKEILMKELHTDNLDFALYTKSESALRKLAVQLAG